MGVFLVKGRSLIKNKSPGSKVKSHILLNPPKPSGEDKTESTPLDEKASALAYEKNSYVQHAVNRLYLSHISPQSPMTRMLDVGCGTGDIIKWCSSYPYTGIDGVDINENVIERAKQSLPHHPKVRFTVGNAENLLALNLEKQYERIFFLWSLNWVKEKSKALQGAKTLLEDDGELWIIVPLRNLLLKEVRNRLINPTSLYPWASHFTEYSDPSNNFDDVPLTGYYLEQLNFTITHAQKFNVTQQFNHKSDFKNFLFPLTPQLNRIPLHREVVAEGKKINIPSPHRDEFLNMLTTGYLKHPQRKDVLGVSYTFDALFFRAIKKFPLKSSLNKEHALLEQTEEYKVYSLWKQRR
jgi:ubiquinone/menaquinone biosynthesis C-methylase UbiE